MCELRIAFLEIIEQRNQILIDSTGVKNPELKNVLMMQIYWIFVFMDRIWAENDDLFILQIQNCFKEKSKIVDI